MELIQKFLNTTPGSEPFALLVAGPESDRQSRIKGYIAQAEVGTRGLACPFAKSDPGTYMSIDACKATEGFKEPRLLFEHIWRKHTRFFRCGFCPLRWSISTSRKEVKEKKADHWKSCDGKLRGLLHPDDPDESRVELLDWKQQELFEKIRSMRDVEAKLEALYKACRKPVPETYRWSTPPPPGDDATAALPTVQPQTTYETGPRTTTHPNQQSVSVSGGFLDGFVRPPSETSYQPEERATAINVSKASAALQARDSLQVSGADRPRDADSGYDSMPKNKGDADDISHADILSATSETYWTHVHHHEARSYAMGGSHVSAVTSGHVANDDNFRSIHEHGAPHGSFQGFDDTSHLLCDAAGSSTRDLLGLALPNPGTDNAEEPLNLWAYTNLDAEFSEFTG
ncbi:hypothetical protein SLS63_002933 [Diaporthe eres]|uniref:Uncharacterized protein n=1 Tax=Diaporthe eres TaxID=83184 RepID=A0ABR1PHU4_DIAER